MSAQSEGLVSEASSPERRGIRSYVIRGGRLTEGQRRGLDEGWPRWGLDPDEGLISPATLFGRQAPLVLEIGFGMGQSLADMAEAEPESDFIGVEVHRPGVGALLMEIERRPLSNLRLYACDANRVIDECLPAASLDRVQLFFPDPWHKKKHHKRRLVQADFLRRVHRVLKPGGLLHIATDWQPYAEHVLEVFAGVAGYRNCSPTGDFVPRPPSRPQTKFERRGERLGHGVWDLQFEATPLP